MPVNPSYLQQNNDFSRKPPFLSILIVIAARQGLLEPPQGDTDPQEPPPHSRENLPFLSQAPDITCQYGPAPPGTALAARSPQPIGTPAAGRGGTSRAPILISLIWTLRSDQFLINRGEGPNP